MLHTSQLAYKESKARDRRADTQQTDGQSLALVRSLANDMPLRMAVRSPEDGPSLSAAMIRLRRFVRFYPGFAGAALFTVDGTMLTNTECRPVGIKVASDLFAREVELFDISIFSDKRLAEAIAPGGSDTVLAAPVFCPAGRKLYGIVAARLL